MYFQSSVLCLLTNRLFFISLSFTAIEEEESTKKSRKKKKKKVDSTDTKQSSGNKKSKPKSTPSKSDSDLSMAILGGSSDRNSMQVFTYSGEEGHSVVGMTETAMMEMGLFEGEEVNVP